MQRSGLGLMVRPETSMVLRCPTQAPSSFRKPGLFSGKAQIAQRAPTRNRGVKRGGITMLMLLTDFVLFSGLALWITGIVIAVASLLS
jgi:hypothetical protein